MLLPSSQEDIAAATAKNTPIAATPNRQEYGMENTVATFLCLPSKDQRSEHPAAFSRSTGRFLDLDKPSRRSHQTEPDGGAFGMSFELL